MTIAPKNNDDDDGLIPHLQHTPNEEVIDEELCCPICEDFCSCGGSIGGGSGSDSIANPSKPIPLLSKVASTSSSSSSNNKKRQTTLSTSLKATSTKKKTFKSLNEDDIADQLALSEFYFNQSSSSDDSSSLSSSFSSSSDEKHIIDYYGYSSSTDVAIDSLFLQSESEYTDSFSDDDDDDNDTTNNDNNNNIEDDGSISSTSTSSDSYLLEEMLINNDITIPLQDVGNNEYNLIFPNSISQTTSNPESLELREQLSKITPQILAAISIATKKIQQQQLQQQQQFQQQQQQQQTSIPLQVKPLYNYQSSSSSSSNRKDDDLLDLRKGKDLFSSSPTKASLNIPKRLIPIDAFRRMRSNFKTYGGGDDQSIVLKTALRHKNMANCTLVAQREEKNSFPLPPFVTKRRNSIVNFDSLFELKDSIWEIEIDHEGLVDMDIANGKDGIEDSNVNADSIDDSIDDEDIENNESKDVFVILDSDSDDDLYSSINQEAIMNDIHSLLLKK